MNFGGLGLQGKFVVALLVATALPFGLGLVIFESSGYRHLLSQRGQLHQMEATTLERALEQATDASGDTFRTWLAADSALIDFVSARNLASAGEDPDEAAREIQRIDKLWESLEETDPLIRATLENEGSANLRGFMKIHPEIAEILATDTQGRLVSATGKSTDYYQADEKWWQIGAALADGQERNDVLRFDSSSKVFSIDVSMPLNQGGKFAGVAKLSVDVTSLFTRLGFNGEDQGERWEIVLPDGRVLASSKPTFESLGESVTDQTLREIVEKKNGWSLVQTETGEARMAGFVAIGPAELTPSAHVMFSSCRDDVVAPLQRTFLKIGATAAGLLTACGLVGFWLIRRNILQPLATLGTAARTIASGASLRHPKENDDQILKLRNLAEEDLQKIQRIQTGDEVEKLAEDLAVMTSRVLSYQREMEAEVAAKTAVIREDLQMAHEFQNALLPSSYPNVPPDPVHNPLRLQFAHFFQPASTVGGDFFDLIELDENRVGILIADVMGHGARSALITAILRALVKNNTGSADDPGVFLTKINHHLHEVVSRSGQTLFVTAFFLVLDTRASQASWAVAGHPAPLRVRRGSGKLPKPLWDEQQHQPALGLMPDVEFRTNHIPLKSGEVFLLFTDGAFEAENPAGEEFGLEKLAAIFDESIDGPMAAVPARIICEVTAFQKRKNFDDDVCLVVIEAVGTAGDSAGGRP